MGSIQTIVGDATKPQTQNMSGVVVIPHVCNNIGAWGAGFVMGINKTFGEGPMNDYQAWHKGYHKDEQRFALGEVQFVQVNQTAGRNQTYIANMVGQHQTGPDANGRPPVRYGAIAEAMNAVGKWASLNGAEIHTPMFGAGLAGGNWDVLEHMIREIWVDKYDLDVTIYEFQPAKPKDDPADLGSTASLDELPIKD